VAPETQIEAVGLFLATRYAEALPLLREMAARGLGGVQVQLYLSECCARLGLAEEAADWGDRATQNSPRSARAWTCCGHALAAQGEWEGALECYSRASELNPRSAAHRLHVGQALGELGCYRDAQASLEAGLALDPRDLQLPAALGRVLARQRRWREALAAYRRAHLGSPAWAEPLYGMGCCLQELGRLEEAAECLHQAVRCEPERAEIWGRLASVLLSSLPDGPLVREVLSRALHLQPDNPVYWSWLGASHAADGQGREAAGCYQQAAILQPEHAEHRYNWGVALGRLGRREDALAQLRRAVELNPLRPDYQRALELWEGATRVA
jgi:tetratricopeptide (TPR) repeat protein